ncbi:MAG: ribosome biogenesis GTPase Der [Alphaproteobacteria bacterium]|nr:ribosome biogenesis GTPase Der [Alphaproteobacteria bacterium]
MTKKIIIFGKPNVGKSSLLNSFLGKQVAVVNNYEGLTRDLKEIKLKIYENTYTVVDSPGITSCNSLIEKKIKKKTILSLEKCNLILLVIDGKKNLTSEDLEIFKIIRKSKKKTLLVFNKTEGKFNETTLNECKNLGFGLPIKISTAHMQGIDHLKHIISEILPSSNNENDLEEVKKLSIAIVGKTNSGKSTLLNSLKGENLSITGDLPNLTRDAVETTIKNNLFESRIIDTAGFNKSRSGEHNINYLFAEQTKKKIRLSRVILVLMDIDDYFERIHSKIINLVYEENRCIILAVNKIDEKKNIAEKAIINKIYSLTPQIRGLPIYFISAKKKIGLDSLILGIKKQYDTWNKRISTGKLNSWLQMLIKKNPPPLYNGKLIKLKYIVQVSTSPPKFNIFLNFRDVLKNQYKRFIENKLKINFEMNGLPLKIIYKKSDNPYE